MTVHEQFKTAADFWSGMVVPDCEDYRSNPTSLRRALHSAISLFHMHDWIFHTHKCVVQTTFTYIDRAGVQKPALTSEEFANSLEQRNNDFGRIRGIANAGKHLRLRPAGIRPVQNAPSDAANTRIQTTAYGQGGFGQGPYGGTPRVVLEGPGGSDMEFLAILENVYRMWREVMAENGW